MKLSRILCLTLTIAISAGLTAQTSFTVGTATAGPGQKVTGTLDVPAGAESSSTLGDRIGHGDSGMEQAEAMEALRPMLHALPERERTIVYLRYWEGYSQSEIADRVGLSQMHVSRLLASSLRTMRSAATAPAG